MKLNPVDEACLIYLIGMLGGALLVGATTLIYKLYKWFNK